ncbi:hypothetical protein BGX23_002572, partial [Mortierella sp. AD031]
VERLVEKYLTHSDVIGKNPSAAHFESAIRVFVHRRVNAPADHISATQPEPLQPVNQGVTTQEGAQQSADLKSILDRLQAVRLQLKENNKSSTLPAQTEEPFVVFNRYNTIDRPPGQRPRPHESGSNYKYRQRYAIKTRTHLKKHDIPESMKQYQLKPWKSPPDSPLDHAGKKNERRPLPKVRDVTNMDKKNLVDAMAWDHPTRTLELGTINSNATRALNRSPEQPGLPALLPRIKSSLSRIVRLSSQVKRTCQRAIGQYIEHLALHHIDEEEDEGDNTKEDNTKEDSTKEDNTKEEPDEESGYSVEERRRLSNFSRSTFLMSLEEMRAHLQRIRSESFQPTDYAGRGYVLRGSIRTDGFRLQAIAFKLNELHCIKYRRLHPDKLLSLSGTSRLTSTLGGTEYFLTEIRNVVTSQQDVADLWGGDPRRIKVLGIDLGQAFVVGASAILPPPEQPSGDDGQECSDTIMESPPSAEDVERSRMSETKKSPPKYFNLACKQKAVYQPTFKHRRWLEQRKEQWRVGGESISHFETSLPRRHGPEASIRDYTARVKEVKDDLDSFYGSVVLKKHKWNARKARTEEYRLIANRLLQLVGGSLGAKRQANDKVVIGVGLGQFSCKTRLSSLHESFQSYFVQKARSLGYIVVGVNEYYTSKKCPVCTEFVGQVDIRRLYCTKCQKYMHRDVMAGHNIANAVQGHLLEQQRPLYLQPVDSDGKYPWMQDRRDSKPRQGGSGS